MENNKIRVLKNLELLENVSCIYRNLKLYKNKRHVYLIYVQIFVEIILTIGCMCIRQINTDSEESFSRKYIFLLYDLMINLNTVLFFIIMITTSNYYKNFVLVMNNLHDTFSSMPSYRKRLRRINKFMLTTAILLLLTIITSVIDYLIQNMYKFNLSIYNIADIVESRTDYRQLSSFTSYATVILVLENHINSINVAVIEINSEVTNINSKLKIDLIYKLKKVCITYNQLINGFNQFHNVFAWQVNVFLKKMSK